MKKLLTISAILLLISACSTKISYISVVAPENERFDARSLNQASVRKNAKGSDWNPIILFFPIGYPKLNNALYEAMTNSRGNAMTNVTIIEKHRWWLLFGYNKIEVNGDVVDVPNAAQRQKRRQQQ